MSDSVSAATTLAILLGASQWPKLPQLTGSDAFANSARDLRQYLLDVFAIPPENLLDYFDSEKQLSEIDEGIERFLKARTTELKAAGTPACDLLVYYVGHGAFAPPNDDYFLALKTTRQGAEAATGLRIDVLAHRLMENARFLRRYVVLDCCFSAKAYEAFQAAPLQVAVRQTAESLPRRGTALLCSSGPREPSKAPRGERYTMFSGALLNVLRTGVPTAGVSMSLHEVVGAVVEHLRDTYQDEAVRPEVHSPYQRAGDVAQIPVFPNLAASAIAAQRRAREAAAAAAAAYARGALDEAELLWGEVLRHDAASEDATHGLRALADVRRQREAARKRSVLLHHLTTRALDQAVYTEAMALVEQDPTTLREVDRAVLRLVEDLVAARVTPERYRELRARLNAQREGRQAPRSAPGTSAPPAQPTTRDADRSDTARERRGQQPVDASQPARETSAIMDHGRSAHRAAALLWRPGLWTVLGTAMLVCVATWILGPLVGEMLAVGIGHALSAGVAHLGSDDLRHAITLYGERLAVAPLPSHLALTIIRSAWMLLYARVTFEVLRLGVDDSRDAFTSMFDALVRRILSKETVLMWPFVIPVLNIGTLVLVARLAVALPWNQQVSPGRLLTILGCVGLYRYMVASTTV